MNAKTSPNTQEAEWGPIDFDDAQIKPGTRGRFNLPMSRLPTGTEMGLPVIVVRGIAPGPTVWLSAAIHGDELNGVEVVRGVLERINPKTFKGTLIAVPVVNVFGFLNESRYTPDRRDLNRSFPGSAKGSLASRVAHLFMQKIVERCDVGIDLHTGSDNRTNLPQIRGNMKDKTTFDLARAFGAPVMMHSKNREGTLRKAATRREKTVLLFEGGEPMRLDDKVIEVGREGVLKVLDMLKMREYDRPQMDMYSMFTGRTSWVRAKRAGVLRLFRNMGEPIEKGEVLGSIEDILGNTATKVKSPCDGVIIGQGLNPIVYQGDAIIHIARLNQHEEEE